ncbi:MAG: hypothetical protein NT045_03835 [Candidatus Aureabacteria bacterium]|nr:hypothetical protein [Candidatus Auribacterota bacterium]
MSVRFMKVAALVACATCVVCASVGVASEKAGKPDFKKMDANSDNKVTEAEFTAYTISRPELGLAKTVFQEWDVDKDGVVNVREFERVYPIKKEGAAGKECETKKEVK